ncbi:MAG: hypothetical protein ABIL58_13805 [Pseudomonadota bacterium]
MVDIGQSLGFLSLEAAKPGIGLSLLHHFAKPVHALFERCLLFLICKRLIPFDIIPELVFHDLPTVRRGAGTLILS